MDNCIFCKIAQGEIPAKKVFEDERCLVFWDIQPACKIHLLAIPKKHYDDVEMVKQDPQLLSHIFAVIAQNAPSWGLDNGYRIVTNKGHDGNQAVMHLHFHIMGGERLSNVLCKCK